MASDANVLVRVGGDVSGLSKGLKKGGKDLDIFDKAVGKAKSNLAALVPAVTLTGIGLMANHAATAAAELQKLAQVSNTTTQNFQRMSAGARTVFIENEKLADIFKDVNDRIGDFVETGGGPMADFFENIAPKIGVTIDQFKRLSGPEALQFFYNSLEAANVSQQQMTFYLESMASDATALIPLLRQNGQGFKDIGDKAEEYGRVLSDIDVQKLTESKRAFDDIGAALTSVQNNLTVVLNPEIEAFRKTMVSISTAANNLLDKFGDLREELSKQAEIEEIIGRKVNSRGRLKSIESSEAAEINKLISRQLELEQELEKVFVKRGGRSAGSLSQQKEMFDAKQEEYKLELEALQKRVELLRQESEAAQKVFDIRTGTGAAEKSMAEVAQVPKAMEPGADNFGFKDTGEDPFADPNYDAHQAKIDALIEKYQTERDLFIEHNTALADLELGFQQGKFDSAAEYYATKEMLEDEHQSKLNDLVKSGNATRDQFDKLSATNKTKFVLGAMQNLTQGIAQHSRKAFEINKAAGIANAIVSTAEGVTKSLSAYPFPINVGMAAASAAAGFAQIQSIRSTSFNGGGRGVAPSQAADPAVKTAQAGGNQQSEAPAKRVIIEGLSPDSLYNGRQIRRVLDELDANGYQAA